jgi:hypothetical protein
MEIKVWLFIIVQETRETINLIMAYDNATSSRLVIEQTLGSLRCAYSLGARWWFTAHLPPSTF